MKRLRDARAGGGYERWERRTDSPLLVLALVFLVLLILPSLVPLTATQRAALNTAQVVIWAVFAVDYAIRLYLAPARAQFVRSHVLDLLIVVLPMLRPLRALRVLRAARIAAVLGVVHGRAQRSLHFRATAYVLSTVTVLLVVAAAAMSDAERQAENGNINGMADGLWWAASTVTTVGYGDRYPTTGAGRLIAAGLMIVGIALLGVITASIAAWFVEKLRGVQEAESRTEARLTELLTELRAVQERLDRINEHIPNR